MKKKFRTGQSTSTLALPELEQREANFGLVANRPTRCHFVQRCAIVPVVPHPKLWSNASIVKRGVSPFLHSAESVLIVPQE